MGKNLWEEVGKVYAYCRHYGDLGKLHYLSKTETWGLLIDPYIWKDKEDGSDYTTKAVLFRVKNGANGNFHNVLISVSPKDGKFHIWCGDSYCQELGYDEENCWFWRNHKKGEPHCKHTALVLQYIEANPEMKREIERLLLSNESVTAAGIQGKLRLAFKKAKSILLYGPTGSGKTPKAYTRPGDRKVEESGRGTGQSLPPCSEGKDRHTP